MFRMRKWILLVLCTALLLTGCNLRTVDQLYCLPKRSDAEKDLQSVIDEAMDELSYSAPIYGENRQVTQKVDLDGDGVEECLVFAKDNSEKPLKILIFCQLASGYVLMDTIEGYGFAFDFVEYAQMDGQPGKEIIVGRQLSDDVMRSVSVYRFSSEISRQLLSVSCNKMLTSDLDSDGISELILFSAGDSEDSDGVLSLYELVDTQLERTQRINLSVPVDGLKRATVGKLAWTKQAIYVTSLTKDNTLLTDVFTVSDGMLTNIASAEPVQSIGSYHVYPEDLDSDGVLELPELVPMQPHPQQQRKQYYVSWYALEDDGKKLHKLDAYMNLVQGWYLRVEKDWLAQMTVVSSVDSCVFYMNQPGGATQKVMTIYALRDSDRETVAMQNKYTILYKGDAIIYAASLESIAGAYGITEGTLIGRFNLMRTELNTDEN